MCHGSTAPGKYEIFFWDKQLVHEYAQVEGASRDVAKLVKVIARNYDVRMGVLTRHFRAQGFSRAAAEARAAEVLAPLRADAEEFARSIGCG